MEAQPGGHTGPHASSSSSDPWESLKLVIERLYMSEKMKLSELVVFMKSAHRFDAGENQYKYHFKKWGWRRSLPTKKKETLSSQLQSRAAAGKLSSSMTYQGRPVDQKQIRRYLKEAARKATRDIVRGERTTAVLQLPFKQRIFLNWNMPYHAMHEVHAHSPNSAYPFSAPTPISDVAVETPPATTASPHNAPSPTAVILKKNAAIDRGRLFFDGKYEQLVSSMAREERATMSEWLYQYWFYAFKTAKSWGRGPKNWTALTLDFEQFKNSTRRSLPSTPSDASRSPGSRPQEVSKPLSLCRWLIHINQELDDEFYENTPSPETPDHNDPRDESSWTAWPEDFQNPSFNTRLRDALEHNDFSTIESKKLPVAIPHIAAAARRSGSELLEETLGFAIMGRNIGLIETTLLKIREANISIAPIHPLHIATSYLDGFRSCCDVLHILLVSARSSELEEMYTNDRGHTVLDNLMLAILKSHSSITPQSLCETLRDVPRFPGEEVDICGRWDADSDCIRQLYASGTTTYPSSWKHKFCHTSVQTICHCIMQIFSHARRQLRNSGSGLYLSQCFACGEPLKFQPLHTLVLTTFHLACSACDGEDLFGMVACLLCLVACGVDPEQTASISVRSLVGGEHSEDQCDHEEMTPSDLSQRLSLTAVELPWSNDVLIGWSVFCSILNSCDAMRKEPEGLDEDEIEEWYYRRAERVNNFIGSNEPSRELSELHRGFHSEYGFQDRPDLATLWAAIQTEILSYRRLDEDSSWISENFNMEDLLSSLKDQNHASVKLIEDGVLNTHCICGWLHPANGLISTLQGVCTEYIANLDVWDRATYSPMRTDW